MRIREVRIRLVAIDPSEWFGEQGPPPGAPNRWHYPVVTVATDEGVDGHTMGYGSVGEGRGVAHKIRDVYAPLLVGQDPLHHEAIWQQLKRHNRHLYNSTDTILGVLDVALWDIAGKVAGLPLAALLGLRRTSIPAYQSIQRSITTPERVAAEVERVKADGFRACKVQFWDGPSRDIPRLRAAREAAGDEYTLMFDAAAGYGFVDALEVGHVLEELGFRWFEEPIPDRQVSLLRRLTEELRIPILAAETVSLDELAEYLRAGAVDMIRGDVLIKCGVTGLRKALAAAELFGLKLEIHTAATPLLDVANLHVACATANCEFFESHHAVFRWGLKGNPLGIDADGLQHVPTGPGLGVEIDWDWIEDHTVEVI